MDSPVEYLMRFADLNSNASAGDAVETAGVARRSAARARLIRTGIAAGHMYFCIDVFMEMPLARNAAETGLMELKIAYLSDMQWTALHPAAGNQPR
ncbi:hypothetical protein CEE55_01825 [Stenotrophomonas pavanii]|uniref:Uncharacterized protein n=1 Tax=Stenotrophomonas pavanii TaxID=487698 RepID=A0A246L5M9_9GAMM|nr:hypothetical protein CEE55_01825 [Stenotrophomonas pavanii]